MLATNRVIKNRYLPERSYLYYKYPSDNIEQGNFIEFYYPMLENIEISESQRPNLGSYDLLGRAGTLYSYHGAKSREFNLRFYLTLPNIIDYITNIGFNSQFTNAFRYFKNERKYEIEKFTSVQTVNGQNFVGEAEALVANPAFSDRLPGGIKNIYQNENYAEKKYQNFRNADMAGFEKLFNNILNWANNTALSIEEGIGNFNISLPILGNLFREREKKEYRQAIEYMIQLLNVTRTSTINHSRNTSLGPPMIYLNHGTMYNNIPCICTNYSVKLVQDSGYHLNTMTPRRIEINMNLSETRVGNFGVFYPFAEIESENLAGWEAILDFNTMDPYNDTFGDYDEQLAERSRAIADAKELAEERANQAAKPARQAAAQQSAIGVNIGGP